MKSFFSSSSQLEISSENLRRRSKSSGCVSGLLRFLSTRRNKSITFVHKNQEFHDDAISESKSSPIRTVPKNASSDSRSEALISTDKFRGARGPIVRLMGLETSEATEKQRQRQVMEALEKCEQDLKALKDFVDALESPPESFRSSSPAGIELFSGGSHRDLMSPVSVLEEISRPRRSGDVHGCRSVFSDRPSANSGRIQSQQRQQIQRKKPGEEDIFKLSKFDRIKIHEVLVGNFNFKGEIPVESPFCSSKTMRESVEGVCKDIAWGQNREVGRIGLALQHQICGDLIEELVKDLKFGYDCNYSSLPFEACKRRLCL